MYDHEGVILRVREMFRNDASGHDFTHTLRVYKTAVRIAKDMECSAELVALGALLHDVDDEKLFDTENYANARQIMSECGVEPSVAEAVVGIISTVSFRGADTKVPETVEGKIVQDADRLDALGAIGIARAFAFGGSRGRCMHDPDVKPRMNMAAGEYANGGTTVNHFYEKLFLLKDLMNTEAARKIAEERTAFMRGFIDEFLKEWD